MKSKTYINKIKEEYKKKQMIWKTAIRFEPKKSKRFWMWLWYFIAFPFVWIWQNFRDWRTIIIFVISLIVVASSVWVFYLLGFIFGTNTDTGKWLIGIGSAVWVWWLSPVGSPYIFICIMLTIGIKALFDMIQNKYQKRKNNKKVSTGDK